MADPSPYIYGTGGFAAVIGFVSQRAGEIGREIPHLIHILKHFPGPSVGVVAGYLAAHELGWGGGAAVIVAFVGLLAGLAAQAYLEQE
jgi:hypothetical protein